MRLSGTSKLSPSEHQLMAALIALSSIMKEGVGKACESSFPGPW